MKILEENIRKNLLDIGLGNNFFGYDNTNSTGNKSKNRKLKMGFSGDSMVKNPLT